MNIPPTIKRLDQLILKCVICVQQFQGLHEINTLRLSPLLIQKAKLNQASLAACHSPR